MNSSRGCHLSRLFWITGAWTCEDFRKLTKAPISLAWRLVGDLLATRVSVGRGDVAATSPGGLAGREGVAVKSNMFDFFCDSLETFSSLQLVSDTSRRLNKFSRGRRLRDVSETSPRPARDQMIEEKLRRRLRNVAATSTRLGGDVSATTINLLL